MDEPLANRVLRQALEVEVERRVHVDPPRHPHDVRELLGQLLADHVDEVRRLGVERPRHHGQRLLRRGLGRLRGDEPRLDHLLQHDVASVACALGRRERRQVVRRVDDTGDRRGLRQGEVGDVLTEEEACAFGDPVNRERPALSEVHLVQVELENLVLRRASLEDERHELLRHLAPHRLLERVRDDVGEEDVLDELLRDRAAAFQVGLVARHVGDERAHHANRIDAWVLVEAAVLDGEYGVHDMRRDLPEPHRPALFAVARHERRQQRRFEREALAGPAADDVEPLQAIEAPGRQRRARLEDRRLVERGPEGLSGFGPAARSKRDDVVRDRELAGLLRPGPLGIPEVVQPIHQLVLAKRLSSAELHRPTVHAGQHALPLAVQARVDEARESRIRVAEDRRGDQGRQAEDDGEDEPPAAGLRAPGRRLLRGRALRRHGVSTQWAPASSDSSS
jgi:hypothetical protein